MPVLANPRQEIYCKHRAKGLNPQKAAIAAGYSNGSGTASNLENDPDVVKRIEEIMEADEVRRVQAREAAIASAKMVGAMTGVSRAWVLEQLAENAKLAANDGEYRDSNSALELIGKELGMFQGASKGTNEDTAPPPMSLDAMTSIMQEAEANRPALPMKDDEEIFNPTADDIRDMLGGQLGGAPNLAKARELSLGSETDIAFHEDYGALPDDEEAPATDAENDTE